MSFRLRLRRLRSRLVPILLFAVATVVLSAPLAAQPPLSLTGLEGGQLSETELGQGAHIIVVWAGWSPRCRDIVPRVNAIAQRWGSRARVVTVNFQEERPAVQAFLASQGLRVPVYLDTDGAFSKKHAVTTLPSLLVFKDGRNGYRGRLPDDADGVIAQVIP